jgi:Cu-Zn family superoxide dismutase
MTMRSGRTVGWALAGMALAAAVGWMLSGGGVRAADMPMTMPAIKNAIAVVQPIGDNKVKGTVLFTMMDNGLHVVADLTGLTPGKHGFHVHEFGDISDLGTRTAGALVGGHFDPGMVMKHGLPDSPMHMAGELGNVTADADGKAHFEGTFKGLTITGGADSIAGRSVVVHMSEDDGTGTTGNAGAKIGVGVIGITKG